MAKKTKSSNGTSTAKHGSGKMSSGGQMPKMEHMMKPSAEMKKRMKQMNH